MQKLLARGYFPSELPPPFQTRRFAAQMAKTAPAAPYVVPANKEPKYVSRLDSYNLARAGTLRRPLAIPNPVNFYQLAGFLDSSWPKLDSFYKKCDNSISRPKKASAGGMGRAYEWIGELKNLPLHRLAIRTGMRYAVRADIKAFYPSIYTHSIPWALHGKDKAQTDIGYHKLFGNKIDRLIQLGQSKQTKGIPIGPDTSYLIAELLLTRIDRHLRQQVGANFFRYMDDYEFGFRTFGEAERGLARFQEVIGRFELSANEEKTRIIELPAPLDSPWPRSLRVLPSGSAFKPTTQRMLLLELFDTTLALRDAHPDQSVVRYAVSKSAGSIVANENWKIYQELLLQLAQAEPAVLPIVLDILATYRLAGRAIAVEKVGEVLFATVQTHASKGHTSEIASAIWGHILFDIPLESGASATVRRIDNSVIALLTLDARSKNLIPKNSSVPLWKPHMTPDGLTGEHWLLAYEARLKKWLPPVGATDYIKTAPGFDVLAAGGVNFYDHSSFKGYVAPSMSRLKGRLDAAAALAKKYA